MPQGKLQVVLVSAKGLENTDFLCNMDPYVLLTCRTQEQKSSVASGKGSEPEWNEDFIFNISEGASELALKIMDSDTGSQDDFVGEVAMENIVGRLNLVSLSPPRNVKAGILKLKNLLEGGSSLHTLIRQATYSFQP
uniref:C2 domain-containing protein n=2 Tax=Gossypium raimondii TaxID=29730 RepID=A0A0D2T7M8_GOSRA|nr:hypothetical protein B456_007G022600 [Gossypium raimondii]